MARQLTAEAEVGVIRAFSKFPKIFNTQLPLTKGHLAHFVLGPVSTCVRERRWEGEDWEDREVEKLKSWEVERLGSWEDKKSRRWESIDVEGRRRYLSETFYQLFLIVLRSLVVDYRLFLSSLCYRLFFCHHYVLVSVWSFKVFLFWMCEKGNEKWLE